MTDVNYPQPLSLKKDWGGWVVDYNIRARTHNKTNVIPRKFPENANHQFETLNTGGEMTSDYYGWSHGSRNSISEQDILPPTGFTQVNNQQKSESEGASIGPTTNPRRNAIVNINDDIKEIRKTCVSPGIIDSLHPISDDSCMMVDRVIGRYSGHFQRASNIFRSYAGKNAAETGTPLNLINSTTQIGNGNWNDNDLNNIIDFVHNKESTPYTFHTSDQSSKWTESDMELHSYIDVEKYNDDVYWNDYDIWDIKRLYKQNFNADVDKDRKIWWDNLYNPYCHDLYEWIDTGLKSNETTRRMTCSYDADQKSYITPPIGQDRQGVSSSSQYKNFGRLFQTGGPHQDHPLYSINHDNYTIPAKCSGTAHDASINCEEHVPGTSNTCPDGCTYTPAITSTDFKERAAVSWDKNDNGKITGFTGTIDQSSYTKRELEQGFSRILPNGSNRNGYYHLPNDRVSNTIDPQKMINISNTSTQGGNYIPFVPEILEPGVEGTEALRFQEPVVINITTPQAMKFCNENDDCAGFLQYKLPDNLDYLQEGNAICDPERRPDIIGDTNEIPNHNVALPDTSHEYHRNNCYSSHPPSNVPDVRSQLRMSGTLTSNSRTRPDRIKNLFVFKKIIGSSDPNDEKWGPNIEADELIRPNKYVYCKSEGFEDIPEEYREFTQPNCAGRTVRNSGVQFDVNCPHSDGHPLMHVDDRTGVGNKCQGIWTGAFATSPFFAHQPADREVPGPLDSRTTRDGGISTDGICEGVPSLDGIPGEGVIYSSPETRDRSKNTKRSLNAAYETCRDKNLAPILEHVSGSGVEFWDTLLYRNLPAYVYKKKNRPSHTTYDYKLIAGSAGSNGIYDELKAEADTAIESVVSQITDRAQINDDYNSFVDGTFSCGNISDDYFTNYLGYNDNDNCTQECKDEIRWRALYKINNCDSASDASADCDCLLQARSAYSVRRNNCIQHKADLKEYHLNMNEKKHLSDSWDYYKEGSQVNEWWDNTSAISGSNINPSRIQHPSNIYLSSLGNTDNYNFGDIVSKRASWDKDGNDDDTSPMPTYDNTFPNLVCCVNSIDLTATGGHIDASNFQQCLSCGSEEDAQCNDIVDPGNLLTGRTTRHPGTTPPPSPSILDSVTSFFDTNNQNTNNQNTNNQNIDSDKSLWDEFIDIIKELFE